MQEYIEACLRIGIETVQTHRSAVSDPRAEDTEIVEYARTNDYIIFTHDLGFGTFLALTQAESPSVVQVRAQNILPSQLVITVVMVLRTNEETLAQEALIVIDEGRARVRILSLRKRS